MTIYLENETEICFDFDLQGTADLVAEKILELEACPYETVINVLLTDDEGIRRFNRDFRGIDRPTDVLSSPILPMRWRRISAVWRRVLRTVLSRIPESLFWEILLSAQTE